MKKCGSNFQVSHSALLNTLEMITVGDNVYIANYSSLLANGEITIGNNDLTGPNVVSSGNHIVQNGVLLKESRSQAVIIGENSWISANCTIVGGENSCQNNPCCWRSMGGKHNET